MDAIFGKRPAVSVQLRCNCSAQFSRISVAVGTFGLSVLLGFVRGKPENLVRTKPQYREAHSLNGKRGTMTHTFQKALAGMLFLTPAFLLAITRPPIAQEKKVAQTNGVDNTKMGAYRSLAQHIYADFQKGDIAAAAERAE